MLPDFDSVDLQCAVSLAHTLNVTFTAKLLNMTQPGVTGRVKRLERQLGYELFERKGRSLRRMTLQGQIFVEEARLVLDHLRLAVNRSNAANRASAEALSISRSHHTDLRLLSIVVAAQVIVGTRILLQPPGGSDEDALTSLLEGEADVALVAWPVAQAGLTAVKLTTDSFVVVIPQNHALRGKQEVQISDLRNEQFIGSQHQFPKTLRESFVAKCAALGFVPGCLCISASPAESVHLVDTGAEAITIVTSQYSKDLCPKSAVFISLDPREMQYEYGAAYRQADYRSVLHTFLEYLSERCDGAAKKASKSERANAGTPKRKRRR